MPRACLPNARFLANADSPLLPLLAPRVFANAPFAARRRRHDATTIQESQKTEDNAIENEGTASHLRGLTTGDANRSDGCRLKLAHSSYAARSSHTSHSVAKKYSISRSKKSSELRYADIFAFGRQQLRHYSAAPPTVDARDEMRNMPARVHRSARRRRSPRTINASIAKPANDNGEIELRGTVGQFNSAAKNYDTITSAGGTSRIRKVTNRGSETVKHDNLFQKRRAKASLTVRGQLENFRSYAHRLHPDWLLEQGRYRHLKRRLFALTRRKPTVLDMRLHKHQRMEFARVFAVLDQGLYGRVKRSSQTIRLRHDPRCTSLAAVLFRDVDHHLEEDLWKRWQATDEQTRETYWPHLLVYLLEKLPGKALLFLRLLNRKMAIKQRHPHIVADAFGHLAKLHASNLYTGDSWATERTWNRDVFVPTFYHTFHSQLSAYGGMCSQDLLFNIANIATIEDLKRIFDLFQEANANMLYVTLLHYANNFARAGEHQYALLCMQRITNRSTSPEGRQTLVNRKDFRWTCALIIRRSMAKGDQYHETTGIVASLVELGVQLDTLLYNTVISNAMEAGDYKTAFAVYNNLAENGLEPSEVTFGILLHGCTMADDPGKFQDFADYCAKVAKELQAPRLATAYLYYLYVRHCRDDGHGPHDSTLLSRAYLDMFSSTPLAPLWSLAQLSKAFTNKGSTIPDFTPMEPPPLALYLMLQLGIRNTAALSNSHVWNLYSMFRHLTQAKHHPALDKLAQEPVIWNAFLLAFCRAQQFESASTLIKEMTSLSPQPNVYSWNIFLQGFFKTCQEKAAERVYEIMRKRGIEPDQFTYGTLLRGYVRMQRFEQIGWAMEHVDAHDQMDPTLLQALARIHDRERVMDTMEKARSIKIQREEQRARELSAREAERWSVPLTSTQTSLTSVSLDSSGSTSVYESMLPQQSSRSKDR